MRLNSRYNLPFRRRREGKTDYKKRKAYILSGLPRLVVRATLKNTIVQIIEAHMEGDSVIATANSKELVRDYQWKGNCGNLSTAYLTGLLAGFKSAKKGVKNMTLDIGLKRATKGSRIFAALKGGLDAGLHIPHSEDVFPQLERIRGEHIATYAATLSSDQTLYRKVFSRYLQKDLNPQDLPDHFDTIKETIKRNSLEDKTPN